MRTEAEVRAAQLARLISEFNLRPDRYVDPSWPSGIWPAPWNDLGRFGERGRAVLARSVLGAANGVAETGEILTDYDFASRDKRLALLPREALASLAQLCGLCLHKPWLTGGLTRRIEKNLQKEFGSETLLFVRGHTPPFDAIGETLDPVRRYPKLVAQKIRARGGRLLLDYVAPAGAAVLSRMRLKLTRVADVQPGYRLSDAQRDEFAELIFMCLIPERLRSWDWLF